MPFFYSHDQHSLVGENVCGASQNLSEMTGYVLKALDTGIVGYSRAYITEMHIQFLLNWNFCDKDNLLY
jgi:hypothetical protein